MLSLVPFNRNGVQRRSNLNEVGDVYNFFDEFFNNDFFQNPAVRSANFRVDVKEEDNQYLVEAELPGFNKEDVSVNYEDGKLLISAKHEENENQEKPNYLHRERKMCSMQRMIYLDDIQTDAVTAELQNGVLKIVLPKAVQEEKKFRIEVK